MAKIDSQFLIQKFRTARPSELFWWFVACHVIVWIVVPTLTSRNAPLDVIEGYAWGHEWLMGTYKHPPMQSWILEALADLTDRAPWAHFFASQIAIGVTFWAVWQTGRKIAGEIPALTGVLLLEGIAYYNFTSPEFNPNVLQLSFWALACWSFHRAVHKNRLTDWLLLGLWAAGGLYSKYSIVVLLVVLGLMLLTHPDGIRRLKSPGPYCAVAVAALLFLPHFLWLIDHQFMPLAYVEDRLKQNAEWHHHILYPQQFLLGQLVVLASAVLLFLTLPPVKAHAHGKPDAAHTFDHQFLNFIVFGPFFLMLTISAFAGLRMRDMWGTPLWNFAGLWAVVHFCPGLTKRSLRRFALAWCLIFVLGIAVYVGCVAFGPYVMNRPLRTEFPGRKLAAAVTATWDRKYHTPLRYVVGDMWVAGNVAYYAPERPHVLIMGDTRISPWIDPEDLQRAGGIIVWCSDHCLDRNYAQTIPTYLTDEFPGAKIQQPLTLLRETEANVPSVVIGWAILPPAR